MSEKFDGPGIARARIAEEAERRTGRLDLGGLGLKELPPELFALRHLRELNLGNKAADQVLRPNGEELPQIGAGRLRVKRRLEALRDEDAGRPPDERRYRTIDQDEFRRLCDEEDGIVSPALLLAYLNNAGTVFYREGLFGDRIVLDQAWALDAIYAVFEREKCYRQLKRLRGRFTRPLLEALAWEGRSVAEQRLFLSMMESCGICFAHRGAGARGAYGRDDDTEYIAPDLLPGRAEVQAELDEKWDAVAPCESAVFDYPFLHAGLMREVIAGIGGEAGVNALYWAGGVCLYETGTRSRALIEQEPGEGFGGRIVLKTQGGQSAVLLDRLAKRIEEAQARMGLRSSGVERTVPARPERAGPAHMGRPDRPEAEEPKLSFGQPPSAQEQWFVSYAWGDATPEGREREAVVDRICAGGGTRGIRVQRDKASLSLGDRISAFMQRIGQGDRVFVVLSDKYLRSPYCMFELFELWRTSRSDRDAFLRRVRVYSLSDADIWTPIDRTRCAVFWKKQHDELAAAIREHGGDVVGEKDFGKFKLMGEFYRHVADILETMADVVQPRTLEELERYGFDDPPATG
jgi:internalin A